MTSIKVNQCSPPKDDAKTLLDLSGKHVHFVGIGGCGMSGLARLTDQCGAICSGTDRVETELTVALENDGIQVAFAQCAESVPMDCDLVVVSAAIALDHPELTAAKQRGIHRDKDKPATKKLAINTMIGLLAKPINHVYIVKTNDPGVDDVLFEGGRSA